MWVGWGKRLCAVADLRGAGSLFFVVNGWVKAFTVSYVACVQVSVRFVCLRCWMVACAEEGLSAANRCQSWFEYRISVRCRDRLGLCL